MLYLYTGIHRYSHIKYIASTTLEISSRYKGGTRCPLARCARRRARNAESADSLSRGARVYIDFVCCATRARIDTDARHDLRAPTCVRIILCNAPTP